MHACVPNATATPPPRVQSRLVQRRPLRVYVFNSSLNCTNERNGKDRYEWLTGRLVPIHMRVSEPGDADLLYHPACLVNAFFAGRVRQEGQRLQRQSERIVLNELSPWPDKPVMINALRCSRLDIRGAQQAYPTLWQWPTNASRKFARTCLQTLSLGGLAQPLQPCSVYMPYFTDPAASAAAVLRPPAARSLDILFIGSGLPHLHRQGYLDALRGMAHTHAVRAILDINVSRSRRKLERMRGPPGIGQLIANYGEARFTLCPPGDTPESQRIYQALQHGSIPLLNGRFRKREGAGQLGMSEPLSCEARGEDFALSERCQI